MEIVRAGLRLNFHDACGRFARLRIVVLQRDFCFANRVQVRIHNDNPENRILVVCAIEFEVCPAKVLAIHENLPAALRIFRGRVAPADQFLRAG